jgi:thioredoxin 1
MIEVKGLKELEDAIEVSGNVLLQFSAAWCGPCRMLSPILTDLVLENKDITLIKIDIDEATELAGKYEITSVPTVIKVVGGEATETLVGVQPKDKYLF